MGKAILSLILVALGGGSAAVAHRLANGMFGPRQIADRAFDARTNRPAYVKQHPRVLFDEAHNNPDTSAGRYSPFVDLIRSDGYKVVPSAGSFSATVLKGYDVLIIVKAAGPNERRDASAFTGAECNAVRDWVKAGGALLLIADHVPFGAAVVQLANRFDVDIARGHTIETLHYNKDSGDQTELVFAREDGLIGEHPITRGRNETERINRVMTFGGTSLKGPGGSVALLNLADTARDVLPPDRKHGSPEEPPADHMAVSASGRAQGLALEFGKGRLVVFSEAAMLTAQIAPGGFRFGMNVSGTENRQLALNIMHWLSGLLK